MEHFEMPIGFGMALAQNPAAMQKFSALPDNKKCEILNGTHSVSSKEEMHRYVERILSVY